MITIIINFQIKRQKSSTSEGDIDDGLSNYDYDNPNDRENFCPDIEQVGTVWSHCVNPWSK